MGKRTSAPPADEEPLAGEPPKPTRCTARTATASRCRRMAMLGVDRCAQHLGATRGQSPGRPSKLTKELEDEIVTILRLGGYAETAAQAAGISSRTYRDWIKRGDPESTKKADARYRQFRARIEQTIAECEAELVGVIQRASAHDWKAAAWLAERRHPDKFAGPRGRRIDSVHPDDFANGEQNGPPVGSVADDQVGPDGRPL